MAKGKAEAATPDAEAAQDINQEIEAALQELSELRGAPVFELAYINTSAITDDTVDDVFDALCDRFDVCVPGNAERIDVLLESSGGSIDAAYNIALLLRRYAKKELNIIIPRWAKSAATVIACAGDRILMTPVAELGPVDPQITMFNPLENRLEAFSPLHIDSTLELIRDEFAQGNTDLAKGLLERLQFPLTLGGIKKSLEVGVHYIERLLSSRMLKGQKDKHEKANKIAQILVHDYTAHSFCIDVDEAQQIGLKAEMLPADQISKVWNLRNLLKQRAALERKSKQAKMREVLKDLPPDLLQDLARDSVLGNGSEDPTP